MRNLLFICAVSLAALVAVTSAGAAAPAVRDCREANGPVGEDHVPIGSVAAVRFVTPYADLGFFATRRFYRSGLRYWAKAPFSVSRGKFVTISIARRDRALADLVVGGSRADAMRFRACKRGRRSFSTCPAGSG
jgi:hypothetical protein